MEQYENLKCNPNSRLIRDFQFNPTYGMMQFFLLFHFTRIAIRIYYGSSIKTFYRDLLSHSLAIRLIPHYPLG